MPSTLVNGVKLNYQYLPGNGADLVLVHGLASNLAFWYFSVVPLLARRFSITLYDLRGHGQSEMPPSGYSTADMAQDLNSLLDHLNVQRAHLVGHSYGGAVALHYTTLYPERVASLTIADARIRSLQRTQYLRDWPMASTYKAKLQELGARIPSNEAEMGYRLLEIMAEAKINGRDWKTTELDGVTLFGMPKLSNRTAEKWLRLLRTTTARSDLLAVAGLTVNRIEQVHQSVLAMYGEYSICMPSFSGLKKHLPNCHVMIVPRAGHFYPATRPAFFVRHLQMFLNRVAA